MAKRSLAVVLAGGLIVMAGVLGCSNSTEPGGSDETDAYSAEVATEWFVLVNTLIDNESFTPPRASRLLGYGGVALYEGVVSGMPEYQSLVGQLNDLDLLPKATDPPYHWPAVANAALATVFRGMFEGTTGATQDALDDLEADNTGQFEEDGVDDDVLARSIAYGQSIGLAVLEWSRRDGYATLHDCAGYAPSGELGKWEPTPPANAPALEPCWGDLRAFVLDNGGVCDPGPPPVFSTDPLSAFWIEAQEVFDVASNLTAEQLEIAQFWADGASTLTPPGHSISIATQVLGMEDASLALAAETYAKVGMAVADAFIGCWWSKFEYDLIRPISCIRDEIDPAWLSPIGTPPFPEYTSGHSTQGGAASEVLTDLFGDDYAFTDHTHDATSPSRSFDSFYEAADEAAISRLYGGIHFRTAIELGVEQGRCIGGHVNALHFAVEVPVAKRVIASNQ